MNNIDSVLSLEHIYHDLVYGIVKWCKIIISHGCFLFSDNVCNITENRNITSILKSNNVRIISEVFVIEWHQHICCHHKSVVWQSVPNRLDLFYQLFSFWLGTIHFFLQRINLLLN